MITEILTTMITCTFMTLFGIFLGFSLLKVSN